MPLGPAGGERAGGRRVISQPTRIAVFALLVVLVIGVALVVLAIRVRSEAKRYAANAIVCFHSEDPSPATCPENGEARRVIEAIRELGELRSFEFLEDDERIGFGISRRSTVRAELPYIATFDEGKARMRIVLSRSNGEWVIDRLELLGIERLPEQSHG